MQELFDMIRRLAPHVRTALVTGETGTGKELVARALHKLGPRRDRKCIAFNCSAVVETLFESELFGHTRGAFTGATDTKSGLLKVADGGTIFLDEIGEIPLAAQAKLLRVLESGEVQRVGAVDTSRVDVNVLAATNHDLRAEVSAGRFRADPFYRLNVLELRVPPLREHREDIPYLTAAFIRDVNARTRKRIVGTSPSVERRLIEAQWEGNIRELRNVIERASILAEGEFITERELNSSLAGRSAVPPGSVGVPVRIRGRGPAPRGALASLEREHVLEVLQRVGGNKMAAARILGVSRRALYRRLERYGPDEEPSKPS